MSYKYFNRTTIVKYTQYIDVYSFDFTIQKNKINGKS